VSGFFYFIPRVVEAAEYEAVGVRYAFAVPPIVTPLADGPNGESGTVLHSTPLPTARAIRWYQPTAELRIGHNPHDPPGPEQLRNWIEIAEGTAVRLGDGKFWLVPRVLPCTERDAERPEGLPQGWRDLELHRPLVEQAERFLAAYEGSGPGSLPDQEVLSFVAAVLGVGYRVRAGELLALGILNSSNTEVVFMDAIDGAERELSRSPAAITQRLEHAGVISWAHIMALDEAERAAELVEQAKRFLAAHEGSGPDRSV
jgi:hypothetical protein